MEHSSAQKMRIFSPHETKTTRGTGSSSSNLSKEENKSDFTNRVPAF
jgi:hypothetical protein